MSTTPRAPNVGALAVTAFEVVVCIALPLVALSWVFGNAFAGGDVTDFENAFYPAAEAVRAGISPYPELNDPELAAGVAYVYPPLAAILGIPLTALSSAAAGLIVMSILVGAVIGTLFVLGVRDWRCYLLVFAWPAVYSAIMAGSLSPLLALAAALTWRFRDSSWPAATSVGLGMALKLILWPLSVWLVATRRVATAARALVIAAALVVLSWAVIGFAGIQAYPELLRRVQELEEADSYTVYALALDLGASPTAARGLGLAIAAALLVAVAYVGRRGDDRLAFVLCIAAVLACTPIVWLHYFALLVVVVAVSQPRLALIWFVPLAMYGSTATTNGSTFQTALTIGAAALTVGVALRASPPADRATVEGLPAVRLSGRLT